MKGVMALFGVGLIFLMLGGIMAALGNFRGVTFVEPHIIATSAGVSQENIVLADPVLDDAISNITIVSTNQNDAPIPYLYSSVNKTLTITGLNPSDTRTLTISYLTPRLDDFTDLAARYFPAFLVLGGISIVVGAAVSAWHR